MVVKTEREGKGKEMLWDKHVQAEILKGTKLALKAHELRKM